ncbi:hypothetical protein NQ317_009276 [Molorchus minor]|uniref:Lipase domain-containing protein n=1 Tax=Molorchus minor TaxID=1323400 RepID=A0ABQ9K190_9CUCU|nr:hypothetical protein NQ317_009276 [Molorchus minor]
MLYITLIPITFSEKELENPETYTGNAFRRLAATLLADCCADITASKRFVGSKSDKPPALQKSPEEDGANMKYFLKERSDGLYEIEDLVNAEVNTRASEADLSYFFYSRNNNGDVRLTSASVAGLRDTDFNVRRQTLFIIHGWTNNYQSPVNTVIRSAVLPRLDVNVFVVDWSPISERNYLSAQGSVVAVGNFLADFVRSLESTYGLNLSTVTFVGHSLGAHIAGIAGGALDGRVAQIVGMDPAGPLFSVSNTNNRLDPTDGQFVQVIHTNGGLLGISASIGDSDYFPNGGSRQPGCGIDITGSCSHSRVIYLYAEAVESSTNLFEATLCESYSDFTNGRCRSNSRSVMGGFGVDTRASGNYYLDTASTALYALGQI